MLPKTVAATAALLLVVAPGCAQEEKQKSQKPEQETDSGLKYRVLERGPEGGGSPSLGDEVTVHYTGRLTDGTVFDSSRERGQPASFVLGRVIEGWNEGLQLMSPGDRFELTVPSELGYGEQGSPPKIPGGATLVFDVELVSFSGLPDLPEGNPDNQKKTGSGVVWETLAKGEGTVVPSGDSDKIVTFEYAAFREDGQLISCTQKPGRGGFPVHIGGAVGSLPFPFLNEIADGLRVGSRIRCEVPEGKALREIPSIWTFELVSVEDPPEAPTFRKLDPEKTETTGSGLRYEVIEEGEGDSPAASSRVTVHYAGWLTDGTGFDSSYDRGQPATFPLTGVIPGWTEGVQLMKPGAVYLFEIPGELAYGKQGRPPKIGPDETLIFRIELIEVK